MELNLYILYCQMHQRRLIKYPFTLCLICYQTRKCVHSLLNYCIICIQISHVMLLGLIIALKHLIYLMALIKVVSYSLYFSVYTLIICFQNFGPVVLGATLANICRCFGSADDIALIAPSIYSFKKMIITWEHYARTHCITFNPRKSKLICFNTGSCHNVWIYLNNMPIVNTKHDIHLENVIFMIEIQKRQCVIFIKEVMD